MLGIEPTVPVDLGIIEAENALFILDFDVQIWISGEEFILKGTKDAFGTYIGNFVDYSPNRRVLVQDNRGDDMFVGEVLLTEIEMGL